MAGLCRNITEFALTFLPATSNKREAAFQVDV